MLTLPPSVKIYVSAQPVDARKSFDGLAALVEAEFGLEPLSGHLFVFLNRRGHVAQMLFWDRSGFCIVKKRLEAGAFKLVRAADATKQARRPAMMPSVRDARAPRRCVRRERHHPAIPPARFRSCRGRDHRTSVVSSQTQACGRSCLKEHHLFRNG